MVDDHLGVPKVVATTIWTGACYCYRPSTTGRWLRTLLRTLLSRRPRVVGGSWAALL